ncbi:antitoxin [Cellulomonas sp. zg-ZUI222]|uniref:Antitoxin n=1 Tax=Cellulomonas wangleii TaxID=2816956 RepID=A0ABX8D3K4_9CELL|nr:MULTISPECIES: antitoxin [Cellulomonas]MBO0898977.1 antitoxin [Cellulomonas sp. zg-ZUI22]MBO0919829.1 antitoxin [Cellulomonas wangleii]MBO0923736.1 antitoxin [Cellulomonas wangleii]MBO0924018.1 antitoxin [Cellulomonas wangleii]QVI62047.1 antitoxin [Cellulomonas wangleii]
MGIDDLVNKARGAVSGREEQAKQALDKAADALKSRTGDGTDAKVDKVVDAAKDQLDKQKRRP